MRESVFGVCEREGKHERGIERESNRESEIKCVSESESVGESVRERDRGV